MLNSSISIIIYKLEKGVACAGLLIIMLSINTSLTLSTIKSSCKFARKRPQYEFEILSTTFWCWNRQLLNLLNYGLYLNKLFYVFVFQIDNLLRKVLSGIPLKNPFEVQRLFLKPYLIFQYLHLLIKSVFDLLYYSLSQIHFVLLVKRFRFLIE